MLKNSTGPLYSPWPISLPHFTPARTRTTTVDKIISKTYWCDERALIVLSARLWSEIIFFCQYDYMDLLNIWTKLLLNLYFWTVDCVHLCKVYRTIFIIIPVYEYIFKSHLIEIFPTVLFCLKRGNYFWPALLNKSQLLYKRIVNGPWHSVVVQISKEHCGPAIPQVFYFITYIFQSCKISQKLSFLMVLSRNRD